MPNEFFPIIRSHLYGPGNNVKILDKIFDTEADAVVLDLEDAVPYDQKKLARTMVSEIIADRSYNSRPYTFVRINHPNLKITEEEINLIVQDGLFGIRIPKVESAEDIRIVEEFLNAQEAKCGMKNGRIKIICNIESSKGILSAANILQASDRIVGFAFGAADFAEDINIWKPDNFSFLYPKSHLVLVSSAFAVQPPVDSVFTDLNDEDGLRKSSLFAKNIGFFGRSAIHPKQISIINDVYTPSSEEITKAQSIINALHNAEKQNTGAVNMGGDFVDIAIVKKAEGIINLSKSLGIIK
ncbi:MAG: citrate lyase subunit beta / citryl-CoA lyase [Chloroflexi bacterium]|jgi:citrate lyase subunit beta/citryl-CoA lyase|nr:MAG: citrate lyase subunit beta / citryl-CoA lyase [Chloroflexota bacterium]|tara:strand:- start:1492 stop:2385 length:894 start_codon:yes stop_codon:yes gene_type:complete